MLLNCDLGESYGSWTMGVDAQVMPHIDQANIACGFHAGDPLTIQQTLVLAAEHGVSVGAHPAYPDLVGFGRRSMNLSSQEIIANLHYQLAALDGMASTQGLQLAHVKPHGALYNDMMSKPAVRAAILSAVASYHRRITLIMQATGDTEKHQAEAKDADVSVQFEAFADRRYDSSGYLLSRTEAGAVLDTDAMLTQVRQLQQQGTVTTVDGKQLSLQADTLCVHGDNPAAVTAIEAVRTLVGGS
ncbi:MAG: UPF0271 protein [Halioglobus sp.]|jgi:UPF0271 protein